MRHKKLDESFLFEGFTVNGKELVSPLSAKVRIFLKRMGNESFGGKSDVSKTIEECTAEALFACTLNNSQRGAYKNDVSKWLEDVDDFVENLEDDHCIEKFLLLMKEEQEALQMGEVIALGKEVPL